MNGYTTNMCAHELPLDPHSKKAGVHKGGISGKLVATEQRTAQSHPALAVEMT